MGWICLSEVNTMENVHKYEYNVSELDKKCILCDDEIINEEFEYEDYFIVFRGFIKNCCYGFMCFDCYKNRRNVKDLNV